MSSGGNPYEPPRAAAQHTAPPGARLPIVFLLAGLAAAPVVSSLASLALTPLMELLDAVWFRLQGGSMSVQPDAEHLAGVLAGSALYFIVVGLPVTLAMWFWRRLRGFPAFAALSAPLVALWLGGSAYFTHEIRSILSEPSGANPDPVLLTTPWIADFFFHAAAFFLLFFGPLLTGVAAYALWVRWLGRPRPQA